MSTDNLFIYGDQNVQVPAHLNFGKFILDRFRSHSDKVALKNGETCEKVTYKVLTQYAVNVASALIRLGVKPGDIIAVGSEPRHEFVAVVFTGATYTPFDLNSGRAILTHKLSLTKPRYMICSKQFWKKNMEVIKNFNCIKKCVTIDDGVESLTCVGMYVVKDIDVNKFEPVEVQGQTDTACILYSSGTTGISKGVQLSHLNCILNSLSIEFKDESLKTGFVYGDWHHNYDIFMTYKFLTTGREIVYLNNLATGQDIMKCVDLCKINIVFLVHCSIIQMTKNAETYNMDSLKIIYSRATSFHRKSIEQVKYRFPNVKFIYQGYGMTEAGELTSESWGTKGPKYGSVGMASPGIIIKVVDLKTRKSLGANRQGEICIKGSVLMKGYIGMNLSGFLDEDGFFNTGDLGYYDEDHYFYISGRLKDIINYRGDNVCPVELEAVLQLHPGVREAGVVGQPVPIYGEVPTAFVVKQPGVDVTEQDLAEYVALQVPPYMQIRGGVKFIDEIPKNSRGKIMRQRLQEMLK